LARGEKTYFFQKSPLAPASIFLYLMNGFQNVLETTCIIPHEGTASLPVVGLAQKVWISIVSNVLQPIIVTLSPYCIEIQNDILGKAAGSVSI